MQEGEKSYDQQIDKIQHPFMTNSQQNKDVRELQLKTNIACNYL